MLQKGWIASVVLVCVIAIFTAFAAGSQPKPVLIGDFAQYIFPALLTICLLVVLYNARVIIEVLASSILGRREQQGARGKSWAVLIGYVITTILIIVLFRSLAMQRMIGALEAAVVSGAAALRIVQVPSLTAVSSPNLYLYYYIVLVFAALVLVSFALLIGGLHQAYSWAREEYAPPTTETVRREARMVVQRAARDLRLAGDYRETILNCYRQMCHVLSLHGFQIRLHDTASEFSNSVSTKLGLGGDSVRYLTFLFEEARYSDHQIDNTKRAKALNQLESLEHLLGDAGS
jgi:hypothetical protein